MTGSTYIEYEKALSKGMKLITTNEDPNFGLLLVCGVNMGLRIGDLLRLDFHSLKSDEFNILEQKTGKSRTIQINNAVKLALSYFKDLPSYDLGGNVFVSQKGSIYSIQHVNRLVKKYFKGSNLSSHSLRKSFGRRVWENNGKSDEALLYLSEIFNHASPAITRRYLGIRAEEIRDIYLSL